MRGPLLTLVAAFALSRALIVLLPVLSGAVEAPFLNNLCQWDCGWYQTIVLGGYNEVPSLNAQQPGAANWAFFPMFPLLVSGWMALTGMDFTPAALLLNNLFALAAALLLYAFAAERLGQQAALPVGLFFVLSPYSLYMSVPYTEAMFNLLSVAALWLCLRQRWLACGLLLAVLSAVRPNGVLVGLACLVCAVQRYGWRDVFSLYKHPRVTCALGLAPFGMAVYALYLHIHVGDALAFAHVQAAWGRSFAEPVTRILDGLTGDALEIYLSAAALLALAAAWRLWVKRLVPEATLLAATVLVAASTGMASMPRYALAIWPAYLVLGAAAAARRRATYVACVLLLAMLVYITLVWLGGSNVVT